jgi:hypothetical protein
MNMNMQPQFEPTISDLERRAYNAMRDAFERLRYLSKRPLNEQGRQHMFLVADAAHNLPAALSGDAYHRYSMEGYVLDLEKLLEVGGDFGDYLAR